MTTTIKVMILSLLFVSQYALADELSSEERNKLERSAPIVQENAVRIDIDFNNKRHLDELHKKNQKLYFKAIKVIDDIGNMPHREMRTFLKVTHGVERVHVDRMLWKVSYPPRVRVSFELDGVHFHGLALIRN